MPDERAALEAQIFEELEELRRGAGATVEAIGTRMTLLDHLGGRTRQEAIDRLSELTELISRHEHQVAVRHALGLAGNASPYIGTRRKPILHEHHVNIRTVQRYEKAGLKALASIIVDKSPGRPTVRFDNTDVPDAQRIADLEMVVSVLMRVIYKLLLRDVDKKWSELADESVGKDMEAFALSLNKVMWRSSPNARDISLVLRAIEAVRTVAPEIDTDWVKNRDDAMRMLEHVRVMQELDRGESSVMSDDEEELRPPKSGDLADIDSELEKLRHGGKIPASTSDTDAGGHRGKDNR